MCRAEREKIAALAPPTQVETRITKRFGLRYPIVQAGMIWASGWRLVAAVSEAGGLGLLGAGSMKPELLRAQIRKVRAATSNPFGVNLPLLYPHMQACVDVVLEEGVKIVFSSAGSPAVVADRFNAASIAHAHVVASVRQAQKCQSLGLAAVVCEGVEAGGHNAPDGTTSMCLIPQVCAAVDLPVIAAGGIADGRGMAAALALGADAVQIGTRFAVTQESSAHANYKAAVCKAGDRDTLMAFRPIGPVRLVRNPLAERAREAERNGASKDDLRSLLGKGRGRAGIFLGDLEEGEVEAGQISGLIDDLPRAGALVHRLVRDYRAARSNLPS
jgi:enoyl-[acyl-carrier protein] reductase II